MILDSDPLSNVSCLSLVNGKKNVVRKGDSTEGGQPGSSAEIIHQQSRWIFHTNNMVIKKIIYNFHIFFSLRVEIRQMVR